MSVLQTDKPAPVTLPRARHAGQGTPVTNSPATAVLKSTSLPRVPALGVAAFFAAGIFVDAQVAWGWRTWAIACAVAFCGWAVAFRADRSRLAAACLLTACLALGCACTTRRCRRRGRRRDSLYANDEPQPVHLVAVVSSMPETRYVRPTQRYAGAADEPRTTCHVRCESIENRVRCRRSRARRWSRSTGSCRASTSEILSTSMVACLGRLRRQTPDSSTIVFTSHDMVRAARCTLTSPTLFNLLCAGSRLQPMRWLGDLRGAMRTNLPAALEQNNGTARFGPVAGKPHSDQRRDPGRIRLDGNDARAGNLGVECRHSRRRVWIVCRLLNLGNAKSGLLVLAFVFVYAVLTGASPPVVRATVLIAILVIGQVFHRRAFHENSLAVAAVIVLAWNPGDLFDVGAATFLSRGRRHFLVVRGSSTFGSPIVPKLASPTSAVQGRWRLWLNWIVKAYLVTACIWIATTPLIAATFHLVSPVGLLINVMLMPVVTVVLWLGYAFLFCGLIFPFLAVNSLTLLTLR